MSNADINTADMNKADPTIYDFQKATADRISEIFRSATIDALGNEKLQGGQRRVLLADEVGLGKTHVAAEVIAQVRDMRRKVDDRMFRVVYVCSNLSIASQNIQKLGIRNKANVSDSRLSMQHLTIREREAATIDADSDSMGEIIIPLTPSTSFSLTGNSMGNANERALIACILTHLNEFKPYKSQISDFFQGRSGHEGWSIHLKRSESRIADIMKSTGGKYLDEIIQYLDQNEEFRQIRNELIGCFENHTENTDVKALTNRLRRIFADLSLSMLKPDLIIMDEFQRFSSLLDFNDDSEQTAIARKFFERTHGQQPLILLMSATPYKPYSTLEELNEHNADTHYDDFNRLMDFLLSDGKEFREVWNDYSYHLSHLSSGKFDVLIASKQRAEEKMYEAVCRTERLKEGLLKESCIELKVREDDFLSYCEMQKIMDECRAKSELAGKSRFRWSVMPVDYVKSAPYLLSFMESYELKRQMETAYRESGDTLPRPSAITLLRKNDIEHFRSLPMRNAKMSMLCDLMLPERKGAELLLWVPASKPYYTTDSRNPFVKNSDFSKMLVFSAWEMVPRAISVLMTYELERRVIFSKYKKARYDATTGRGRLKNDALEILTEPSQYLASLYNPEYYYGRNIDEIKAAIRNKISGRLEGIQVSERRNYAKILSAIRWLDNPDSEKPVDIPANTIDILTDMAIAGPGVCLQRIFKNPDTARNAAKGFITIFNRRVAGYIIDKIQEKYHTDEVYLEGVMNYCVMGNLQAVLDEYHHLSGNNFSENMENAFINETNLKVDTDGSFGMNADSKSSMRVSYGVPYSRIKSEMDEKSQKRTNNIRCAFQSPFYPFILSTTSVGQEGLDFHWYCRRIMHWNLPSNPQDLEQREGRINRYKCLAIRRNLARLQPDLYIWESIFSNARSRVETDYGHTYSHMVPYWCLPTEWIEESGDALEKIERIVPQYPLSIDIGRYQRLKNVLSLYRLTMGQPRQEELLDILGGLQLTADQIDNLLINLSPIERKQKN